MENNHTLFLTTLAASWGFLGSNKEVHLSFNSIEAFLSWLGVSDNGEASNCQKIVQQHKDKRTFRIVGGCQWENVNLLTPLQLFICQTFPKVEVEDDDRLDTAKVNVVGTSQSFWDVQNDMFT